METVEAMRERLHARDLSTYRAWGAVLGLLDLHERGVTDAAEVVAYLHEVRAEHEARDGGNCKTRTSCRRRPMSDLVSRLYGLWLVARALFVLALPKPAREYALCGSDDTLVVKGRRRWIRDDRTGELRRVREPARPFLNGLSRAENRGPP